MSYPWSFTLFDSCITTNAIAVHLILHIALSLRIMYINLHISKSYVCFLRILTFCNFIYFPFGFLGQDLDFAPVPGHCSLVTLNA